MKVFLSPDWGRMPYLIRPRLRVRRKIKLHKVHIDSSFPFATMEMKAIEQLDKSIVHKVVRCSVLIQSWTFVIIFISSQNTFVDQLESMKMKTQMGYALNAQRLHLIGDQRIPFSKVGTSRQTCAPENKRGNGSLFKVKVEGHSRADRGILKMESPRSNQPKWGWEDGSMFKRSEEDCRCWQLRVLGKVLREREPFSQLERCACIEW